MRLKIRGLKQTLASLNAKKKGVQEMKITDLGEQLRDKIIEGIRKPTGRIGYHVYPSKHPFALEQSVKIAYPGKGRIMATAYARHAQVVEEGRKSGKKRFMVFPGYYSNPFANRKSKYGKFTVYLGKVAPMKGKKYMFGAYLWMQRKLRNYFDLRLKKIMNENGKELSVGITKI